MPPVKAAWCCQHVCGFRYADDRRPSAQRYTLGYAAALRRLVGASDHDHCRVSGEGAAVGGNRLTLADSDSAADRLRLGLVSGRVLDDRLGELLVGEVIDRALLEAGGGDLVAQPGRQMGNHRAVEDGNGDVAGRHRGAVAFRLVVRLRVAGVVTAAVVAGQL